MKKKLFTKLLAITLVCVMLVMSMGAYSGDYQKKSIKYILSEEEIMNGKDSRTVSQNIEGEKYTVEESNEVFLKRAEAVARGYNELEKHYSTELKKMGVNEVSYEKAMVLTNNFNDIETARSADYTKYGKFETTYYTINYNGESERIMRMSFTPLRPESNMWHTNDAIENVYNAGILRYLNAINITAEYAVGLIPVGGKLLSLAVTLKNLGMDLIASSEIDYISSKYDYDAVHNVHFYFYWSDVIGQWASFANTSFVGYAATHTLKSLKVDGINGLPIRQSTDFSGTLYNALYDDDEALYEKFMNYELSVHDLIIDRFIIEGIKGEKAPVINIRLKKPTYPGECI